MNNAQLRKRIILFVSVLLVGVSTYSFVGQLDFFITKKRFNAEVIGLTPKINGNESNLSLKYLNRRSDSIKIGTLEINRNKTNELSGTNTRFVDIYQTAWFNKLYLAGYKNPGVTGLALFIAGIILGSAGIKVGSRQ